MLPRVFPAASRALGALGQQRVPSVTDRATSTTRRLCPRAWSRSRSNASRSSIPWRSIRIPLARSISARRSSADSSWSTLSCSRSRLLVAAQRDLDRALDRPRARRLDPRGDPRSAARATKSTSLSRVWAITGPDAYSTRLRDQRERVLVVAVDDDDREIRVLGGDQLDRLRHGHHVRGDLVAEALEHAAERVERVLVLVGDQDAQVARLVGHHGVDPVE